MVQGIQRWIDTEPLGLDQIHQCLHVIRIKATGAYFILLCKIKQKTPVDTGSGSNTQPRNPSGAESQAGKIPPPLVYH